jgi:hypothetical protein
MQFETLLGSAAKAKDRMEEIKRFAASTPFEVANLSETSKLLQTLGGDLLATGAGLRMVGDAAAIAGQPIQEVGLHFGRLFNAITSGTSAGESIGRLQELGLMTGKVKIQFEALAAAQKKGEKPILTQTQAMTLLQGVFSKTAGAMERLSTTTEGKVGNMRDSVNNLKVAFGTGFNDGLKAALDATNSFLPQLEAKFAQFGQMLGTAIKQALDGDYQMLSAVGEVIGEAIMAGMRTTIKVGATSLLRDGIGGYVGLGGHLINDPSIKGAGKAINAMIGSAMGPRPGMADTLQGELQSGGMSSALGRVQSANLTPTWAEELEMNRKLTEELVSQGKTSIAELKKAFGGKSQVMFSR